MNARLSEIMSQKITKVLEDSKEIQEILESLDGLSDHEDFAYGVIVGRLYNSFHYQCRRILGRSPTREEFAEFVSVLKSYESELRGVL